MKKISTINRCTGRSFTNFTLHSDTCCDLLIIWKNGPLRNRNNLLYKIKTATISMPCLNICIRPPNKNAFISFHSLIKYQMSNMASTEKASVLSTYKIIHDELVGVQSGNKTNYPIDFNLVHSLQENVLHCN